jgi:Ca-activated chloride channel homolog
VHPLNPVQAFALITGCCLLAVSAESALTRDQAAQGIFRSRTDLVYLDVTVTDRGGRPVTGLQQDDFLVFEDGVAQDLQFFTSEPVPLDVAVVIDTSGSMRQQMPLVRTAAVGFVRALRAGDRGAMIEFGDVVRVPVDFTGDHDTLETAIGDLEARGATSLYDAVYVALHMLAQAPEAGAVRRRSMVVLSDGNDTSSLNAFEDVLEAARRSNVSVFAVSLAATEYSQGADAEREMKRLAAESGGRWFRALHARELTDMYAAIIEELSHQYSLGYVSTNTRRDGSFRRIAVRINPIRNARARTRAGYVAPSEPRHWPTAVNLVTVPAPSRNGRDLQETAR